VFISFSAIGEYESYSNRFQSLSFAVLYSIVVIASIIIELVLLRIAFEFLISVFNISESLKRLEEWES